MTSRLLLPLPKRIGDISTPSKTRSFGKGARPKFKMVGNKSSEEASSCVTTPDLIFPGHHAMPGSRIPPSQVLFLPSRNGPAEPPARFLTSQGPLSLVKNTKVSPSNFSLRKV